MPFIEQTSVAVKFTAFFLTTSGFGATGLVGASSITVDVYNPAGTKIVNGVAPIEVGGGWYSYTLSGSSTGSVGEYQAVFKTTDVTCSPKHVSDSWSIGRTWVGNLDQAVSSRSTLTAGGVWTYGTRNLTDFGATVTDPSVTPTVSATGGGSSGGSLQAGSYYLRYTFANSAGETLASPASSQFTVSAGNIPSVTLPTLGSGATSINIYLTAPNGQLGSETLYKTGVTGTSTTLTTATSSGVVNSVNVTAAGSGYVSAPTVTFSSGSATATATVSGGAVTAITVTGQGSGYSTAPTITLTGGSGSGATATAQIITGNALPPNVNTTNTLVTDIWTASSRTLSSFGFNVTVGSNTDKTGYKLASDGLDSIAVTDPGAITNMTTLPKMLVGMWRYWYKKTTATSTQLKTYNDDNATVNVTMALTNDGTTQTKAAGA